MPDMRIWLILFGLLQVAIGVLCAVLLLGAAAQSEWASAGGLASSLVFFGIATLYFISVGVGSMLRRRWARALSVVVSAMWAAGGVVTTIVLAVVLPATSPGTAVAGSVAASAVALIALPLILFAFYRSTAVRAAFESADQPRWTDRVPLPVLAVVLALAFGAVVLLANLGTPMLTLFGTRVSGAPAAVGLLAFSILCAFLAMQLYRLRESAWWTLVLLQIIGCATGVVTVMRSGNGTAASGEAAVYRNPLVIAIMIATWLAYFGFLLFLRRYFRLAPRTRRSDRGAIAAT